MSAKHIAQGLAGLGRYGDSTLVHMNPREVEGLQAIARAQGTTLTTNPDTGLPEAFNMDRFLRSVAPTLAGIGVGMIPGMQHIGFGIAAGALTGAAVNPNNRGVGAITGALGGAGGSNLAQAALNPASAAGAGSSAGSAGASTASSAADNTANLGMTSTGNQPFMPEATTAYTAPAMPSGGVSQGLATPEQGSFGPNFNLNQTAGGFDPNNTANLAYSEPQVSASTLATDTGMDSTANGFSNNIQQAYQNVANDPMAFVNANKMGIGMPLAMGALQGMAPEDMGMPAEEKYDPNLRLNLGGGSSRGESGLRLLAGGGPVSFEDGGSIQAGGLQDLYGTRDDSMTGPALSRDGYGMGRLNALAAGGMAGYAKGGYLDGPGDGMSDSIPATIEGKQPARLADGEFVVPADVVSHLGNGSTKAGSKRLYAMLDKVRKARTGNKKQGKQINPNKFMPA